ncbi:MAG: hypothetical protein AB1Z57_09205 [Acidimicrobiia bacterium]
MTDWRKALDHLRSDAAAIAALDVLAGMPLLTASPPARATGRSEAAISDAIGHLVGAGVASERNPECRRGRARGARGLCPDLLEGVDSEPVL